MVHSFQLRQPRKILDNANVCKTSQTLFTMRFDVLTETGMEFTPINDDDDDDDDDDD